jgi:hypothetical protein
MCVRGGGHSKDRKKEGGKEERRALPMTDRES